MTRWEAEQHTAVPAAPGEERRSSRKCDFKRTTSRAPGSQTALQQTDRRAGKHRPRVLSGLLISSPRSHRVPHGDSRVPQATCHQGPGQLSCERRIRKSSESHRQKRSAM